MVRQAKILRAPVDTEPAGGSPASMAANQPLAATAARQCSTMFRYCPSRKFARQRLGRLRLDSAADQSRALLLELNHTFLP